MINENIKGISNLSEDQKNHMVKVHSLHISCNGLERQKNMQIKEVWIDKNDTLCVRLCNGEWYHYYSNSTWG